MCFLGTLAFSVLAQFNEAFCVEPGVGVPPGGWRPRTGQSAIGLKSRGHRCPQGVAVLLFHQCDRDGHGANRPDNLLCQECNHSKAPFIACRSSACAALSNIGHNFPAFSGDGNITLIIFPGRIICGSYQLVMLVCRQSVERGSALTDNGYVSFSSQVPLASVELFVCGEGLASSV